MVKESYLAQFYGKSQNYTDIPNKWYKEYDVKKGLRNEDGTGVRVGLTRVADVVGYEETKDGIQAIPGRLLYRGIDVLDLVKGKREAISVMRRFAFCFFSAIFQRRRSWKSSAASCACAIPFQMILLR